MYVSVLPMYVCMYICTYIYMYVCALCAALKKVLRHLMGAWNQTQVLCRNRKNWAISPFPTVYGALWEECLLCASQWKSVRRYNTHAHLITQLQSLENVSNPVSTLKCIKILTITTSKGIMISKWATHAILSKTVERSNFLNVRQ